MFLIDTGADSTIVDFAKLPLMWATYSQGNKTSPSGLGGRWPARVFNGGWSFKVLVPIPGKDKEFLTATLEVPKFTVMSPWAEEVARKKDGRRFYVREEVTKLVPTSRQVQRGAVTKCPPMEALLGRDFFKTNQLALYFDPTAESYVNLVGAMLEATATTPLGKLHEPKNR